MSTIPSLSSTFNNKNDVYSKDFHAIDIANTIGEWVSAFNNNALASTDHKRYLNEMLFNGILYTGLETVGGQPIASLTNLNVSSSSPQNLELDNFYIYFRDSSIIKLLDQVTFDLSEYADGHPHFFYINSDLGYRVSQDYDQQDNEVQLFRFIISEDLVFTQLYITAQRFGSNVYDTAKEYFEIKGCRPLPLNKTQIKLDNGTIRRSGLKFDYHQIPDVYSIKDEVIPMRLRYITVDNKVDFSTDTRDTLITNKVLNYTSQALTDVADNKYTAQRILFDIYSDCLIFQYGNTIYNSMEEALTSINNIDYNFPYNSLMFIPLGELFIKSNCTDLTDTNQALFIQQLNTTIAPEQSLFFAEDAYARGRLEIINNQLDSFQTQITNVLNQLNNHTGNKANPHNVTKSQVGLSNVDNYSYATIKTKIESDLSNKWIKKNTYDSTSARLDLLGGSVINGLEVPASYELNAKNSYILVNNQRLYVGTKPGGTAPVDSWAIFPE